MTSILHRTALCLVGTVSFSLSSAFLPLNAQAASSPLADRTGFYFDTVITISLYDTADETILDDCFSQMAYFENTLSRTVEGSDIWNINHSNGKSVEVSDETIELLSQGIYYGELTNGALNIAIEPVSSLWDFHEDASPFVPDEKDIKNALSHVDLSGITIEGNTVTLSDPEGGIDLGAIAKGYISDKLRDTILSRGCQSALINLGGNVMAVGAKPDDSAFTIGIRRPFGTSAYDIIQKIPVVGSAVITSGTYERYFMLDDKLYHHILHPDTGYPTDNGLTSVSIASEDGTEGDCLSTACFVLGSEKGMELIETLDGTEAMFIDTDGNITQSSGWIGSNIS